ncbi:MAG: SPOR domain-containing protein [Saprospiraceae bacterium]|nr:SPOR domain-containing protein [Saprospiraceae bacterium]
MKHVLLSMAVFSFLPLAVHSSSQNSTLKGARTGDAPGVVQSMLPQQMWETANAGQDKAYFIQITSLSKYNSRMDDRFTKWASYGNVYKFRIGDLVKIRIGPFSDLNEAVSVLNSIKRNGMPDAFIVSDTADPERASLIATTSRPQQATAGPNAEPSSAPSADPAPPAAKPAPPAQEDKEPAAPAEEGKFKVRVTEYKAPDWFDVTKISDLGTIEHWTKSGKTIIVLGAYLTEGAAKEVLSKLRSRGFKEAYLVVEENGKLYKL